MDDANAGTAQEAALAQLIDLLVIAPAVSHSRGVSLRSDAPDTAGNLGNVRGADRHIQQHRAG